MAGERTRARGAGIDASMNDKADGGRWRNSSFVDNAAASRLSESLTRGNALRDKTTAGFALGTFVIEHPAPATFQALGLAGFDFVVIDMEHSAVDFTALEILIAAGQAAGLAVSCALGANTPDSSARHLISVRTA